MTFSITARCRRTGQFGVAAVTGTPGVGKLLSWARRRTGAAATQSWINPYLGIDAIALLSHGHPAATVTRALQAMDTQAQLRQLAVVDNAGRTAAWTGSQCGGWAGHREGDGWVCAGNLLAGAHTLDAICEAFDDDPDDAALVDRLMAALEAGEAAGGDTRGARSATLYVVEHEEYPLWDVRVDDHDEPLAELRRIQQRFAEELLPQIRRLPTRDEPRGRLSTDSDAGRV